VVRDCTAEGGDPLYLRARGNDSSLFPKPAVLCLPPQCTVGFVRQYWLLRVFFERMRHAPDCKLSVRALRGALRTTRVHVERLVLFPRRDLPRPGFVIAGFPLSGTTSLVTELRRHPQVAMPHHEDQIYWSFFFTRRSLQQWSRPYYLEVAKKRAALHRANSSCPVLIGLKDPFMVFSMDAMQAAARVPSLKVIILLRDPMAMIQSWINHGAEWINPFGDLMGYWVGLLHRHTFFNVLGAIPRRQLLVVPTVALSRAPKLAYHRIMRFLGLPEISKDPFQQRENQFASSSSACNLVGRCLDFCKAPDALPEALHALVKSDAQLAKVLLEEQGWPDDFQDLVKPLPLKCPGRITPRTQPPAWAETDPGICHALHLEPSICFNSFGACRLCCEQHVTCALYSQGFAKCCLPLERTLLSYIRKSTRLAVCGKARSWKFPCSTGFGRRVTSNVP